MGKPSHSQISKLLSREPGLRGRQIAKKLGLDKTEVNRFLGQHPEQFEKDSDARWRNLVASVVVTLPGKWLRSSDFERALCSAGNGKASPGSALTVQVGAGCKFLIDCIARLLAHANQAAAAGVHVTLDFTEETDTLGYLDRVGFFKSLRQEVEVSPQRPRTSAAELYAGQSDNLVEFRQVADPIHNPALVDELVGKFVRLSNEQYQGAVASLFTELVQNVTDHAESPTGGSAGLQKYGGRRPHIRTVVSDSGLGIAKTLWPVLPRHYPDLFEDLGAASEDSDIKLVSRAFIDGGISRFGEEGGAGLKNSYRNTQTLRAKFEVRQDTFALEFAYQNGALVRTREQRALWPLLGTHICFDFSLE